MARRHRSSRPHGDGRGTHERLETKPFKFVQGTLSLEEQILLEDTCETARWHADDLALTASDDDLTPNVVCAPPTVQRTTFGTIACSCRTRHNEHWGRILPMSFCTHAAYAAEFRLYWLCSCAVPRKRERAKMAGNVFKPCACDSGSVNAWRCLMERDGARSARDWMVWCELRRDGA
eukprot:1643380-Pleurochrysis_carterae.AAC.4